MIVVWKQIESWGWKTTISGVGIGATVGGIVTTPGIPIGLGAPTVPTSTGRLNDNEYVKCPITLPSWPEVVNDWSPGMVGRAGPGRPEGGCIIGFTIGNETGINAAAKTNKIKINWIIDLVNYKNLKVDG